MGKKVKLPQYKYKWVQKWSKNEEELKAPLGFSDLIAFLNLSRRTSENIHRCEKTGNESKASDGRPGGSANTGTRTSTYGEGRNFTPAFGSYPPKNNPARSRLIPPYSKSNFEMKNNTSNDAKSFNNGMKNEGTYETEAASQSYCLMCEQAHNLEFCSNFIALSADERSTLCRNKNVCFKCLKVGHRATLCSSSIRCIVCKGPHHGALHGSSPPSAFVPNKVSFAVKPATPAPRAAATPTAPQESA